MGILTKKITEEPYKLFKTLKPFTLKVWGAIGMVIIVVGIFLYIVNRLSPYTVDGQDLMVDTAHEQKKLKENMWLIYGSFLEQGRGLHNINAKMFHTSYLFFFYTDFTSLSYYLHLNLF